MALLTMVATAFFATVVWPLYALFCRVFGFQRMPVRIEQIAENPAPDVSTSLGATGASG